MTLTTTLNEIRKYYPCLAGWKKLLKSLGKTEADDEPLPIAHILESNGVDDFLWCLRVLPREYRNAIRLLACDIAERALRVVQAGEGRPRRAIEVSRRHARGEATDEDLSAANLDAWAVQWVAEGISTQAAARATALASEVRVELGESACAAAQSAVRAAVWGDEDGAWKAERTAQAEICRKWLAQFDGEAE